MNTAPSSSGGILRFALIFLLVIMIGALWYDYKVARFNVESAMAKVDQLAANANNSSGKKYLTNEDVRAALSRQPARTFDESGYRVEVFSWRAGIPVLTRDYFAVFTPQGMFLKHYTFELPMEELTGDAALIRNDPVIPVTQLPPPPSSTGGGPGRRESSQDPAESSDSKASDTKEPDSKESDPKASDPKASDPKASDAKASDSKEPEKKDPNE